MSKTIEAIDAKYKSNPLYGVQFSIESDAYECSEDIRFSGNTTQVQHGDLYNWQDVLLQGEVIGFLEEIASGKLFHPMVISFYVPIPDDEMTDDIKSNPHYYEGEYDYLKFGKLQDMVDYVKSKKRPL